MIKIKQLYNNKNILSKKQKRKFFNTLNEEKSIFSKKTLKEQKRNI